MKSSPILSRKILNSLFKIYNGYNSFYLIKSFLHKNMDLIYSKLQHQWDLEYLRGMFANVVITS